MWNGSRASFIKDSISKWNHFFIELSSYTDINYCERTPLGLSFLWFPF